MINGKKLLAAGRDNSVHPSDGCFRLDSYRTRQHPVRQGDPPRSNAKKPLVKAFRNCVEIDRRKQRPHWKVKMVLQYMISDTDLLKAVNGGPTTKVVQRNRPRWWSAKKFCLLVFITANAAAWTLILTRWGGQIIPTIRTKAPDKSMVTGIVYDPGKPSAIVLGTVVHEGDVVGGYKVTKIHKNRVELEKEGIIIEKQVDE
jgi:hypothetical protein